LPKMREARRMNTFQNRVFFPENKGLYFMVLLHFGYFAHYHYYYFSLTSSTFLLERDWPKLVVEAINFLQVSAYTLWFWFHWTSVINFDVNQFGNPKTPLLIFRMFQVFCFAIDVLKNPVTACCSFGILLALRFLHFNVSISERVRFEDVRFFVVEAFYCCLSWFWLTSFFLLIRIYKQSVTIVSLRREYFKAHPYRLYFFWCLYITQLCATITRIRMYETTLLAKIILFLNLYYILAALKEDGAVSWIFEKYVALKRKIYAPLIERRRRELLCEVIEDFENVKIIEEMTGKIDEFSEEVIRNVGLEELEFFTRRAFRMFKSNSSSSEMVELVPKKNTLL